MRRLRHIRSDGTVVIEHRSPAALSTLSLPVVFAIGCLAWIWEPLWPSGRWIVGGSFLALCAVCFSFVRPRRHTRRIAQGATLTWESGLESDDPYSVTLHQDGESELLLQDDDPATVLASARRVARETGAVLLGPDWLSEANASNEPNAPPPSTEEGLIWPAQLRASRTAFFGALFILIVFVGSIRAESELSLLSAGLPLLSVLLAVALGWWLSRLRIHVESGPDGLRAERRGLGGPRRLLALPLSSVRNVQAVGHAGHPERHLLVETSQGPVALLCAEATARRVARAWANCVRPRVNGAL